ncbi:ATP-binding protein [Mucilaginibacter gotjawali]|uniref:Energy-coupling factor transporter ATP-binding protein EcfA2 n=1 Tax=Mucilaginibacter gotjawali TaxID=1550579 RepID=A0A839SCM0_9SPHI|nr:ATP-binding protein [Mucilaginibacter gotjawali]MBB3055338.1 energy-coupling factor transporter ATP-binding protein EcfA2 [Mucilaginibacter gotjawali]
MSFNWELEKSYFNELTLLVGASGVGKTLILKAINNLKDVALGKSNNGIEWEVEFMTIEGIHYKWTGEFENRGRFIFPDFDSKESQKNPPSIIREKIFRNDIEIVNRSESELFFKGEKTLKLPQQKSIIYLLKEEEVIGAAYNAFNKIIFSDQSDSQSVNLVFRMPNLTKLNKYETIEEIKKSDEQIIDKLFFCYQIKDKVFFQIKDRFIDIFPNVEDIKVEPLEEDLMGDRFFSFLKDSPFIQIKEVGVDKWIQQTKISSGMFRTLIHISELYLSPEGTIFLIDEFENSLGINCIDELTTDILESSKQLQFIITSHHPYIINNIHFSNWKLVTRKAGIVKTKNAQDYNIGDSKHEAFMQLLQLEEFQTGQE